MQTNLFNWKEMIFRTRVILISGIFTILPILYSFAPQEARVNQKKIERERGKKQKEAIKQYEQAVKRHKDNQSKATKKSMKKTKKESKNITPLNR